MPNSIPFLRDKRNVSNQTFSRVNNPLMATQRQHKSASVHIRAKSTTQKRLKKREVCWNNYIKPISGINEKVHSSQRTIFEKI